jgi:hypothetical protein
MIKTMNKEVLINKWRIISFCLLIMVLLFNSTAYSDETSYENQKRYLVKRNDNLIVIIDYKDGKIHGIAKGDNSRNLEIQLKKLIIKTIIKKEVWKDIDLDGEKSSDLRKTLFYVARHDVDEMQIEQVTHVYVNIYMVAEHIEERAKRLKSLISKYSKINSLNEDLVENLIRYGSYYNPMAVSDDDAKGLMLIPAQSAISINKDVTMIIRRLDEAEIFDPDYNIMIGTTYLRHLYERYDFIKDMRAQNMVVVLAYHWGVGKVDSNIRPTLDIQLNDVKYRLAVVPGESKEFLKDIKDATYLW